MKILTAEHNYQDYEHALDHGVSTSTLQVEGLEDYEGVPAHVFFDIIDKKPVGFAVPYMMVRVRNALAREALGLSGPLRLYSAFAHGFSRLGNLVEADGGQHRSWDGHGGIMQMKQQIEDFNPNVIQGNARILWRLANVAIKAPSLEKVLVTGGCDAPPTEVGLTFIRERLDTTVRTFLHLPWAGIVAWNRSGRITDGYVGEMAPNTLSACTPDGQLGFMSPSNYDVQMLAEGKWSPLPGSLLMTHYLGEQHDNFGLSLTGIMPDAKPPHLPI